MPIKDGRSGKVTTPMGILSYPHLFEPSAFEGQKAKFSCKVIFPAGTDLSELRRAVETAGQKGFDGKRPPNYRDPFRDCAEKKGTKGYDEGGTFISCTSYQPPGIVGPDCKPITDPYALYPGCKVRCTLVAFAYDRAGNRGVSFGLRNVQKMFDGEKLGTHTNAEEDFEEVEQDDVAPGEEKGMFA